MEIRWTVYVQREGSAERHALVRFRRPVDTATVSDFVLSIAEGRLLLRALQDAVAQHQVVAYDLHRRQLSPRRRLPSDQGLASTGNHDRDWERFASASRALSPAIARLNRWMTRMSREVFATPELLDGRLEGHFAKRFPHFRTLEIGFA
jgi:hypothetical protein